MNSQDTNNTILDLTETDERNTQLIEREEVEGTPFTLIKHDEQWYILMGRYRLSEGMTKEDALKNANTMDWNKILQVMTIIVQNQEDQNQPIGNI